MKKEYKYTINGNQYEVAIGDIADTVATVVVNGEEYKVEWEPEAEPEKKVVVRKPAAETADNSSGSAAWRYHVYRGERRRRGEGRSDRPRAGSHEDGEQHRVGERR